MFLEKALDRASKTLSHGALNLCIESQLGTERKKNRLRYLVFLPNDDVISSAFEESANSINVYALGQLLY